MLLYKPITNCKFQAFVKGKEVRTSNRLYVLIWKVSVLMSHTRLQVMKCSAPCARLGLSSLKHLFTVYSPDGCSVRRLHHQAIECIANDLFDGEERIQKQNRLKNASYRMCTMAWCDPADEISFNQFCTKATCPPNQHGDGFDKVGKGSLSWTTANRLLDCHVML